VTLDTATSATLITSRSPQRPDDLIIETPATSAVDVAKAAETARTAGRAWAAAPAAVRSTALQQAADVLAASSEIIDLVVREVGKPIAEARGEVGRGVAILRYYAQAVFDPIGDLHSPSGSGLLFSQRRPRGVAGLITPWNFPVAIPLWKAAPALAYGNGVLLKPAPEATATALALAELFADVLPEGLFQVLPGDAETGQAIIDAADVVSFTGSAAVGRLVANAAVARGVPVQAEMGGQNASIVLPDADLKVAATNIAAAAFGYAGQKCTATSRVIVVGDPAPFTEAFVETVRALPTGDPQDASTVVGPVITEQARTAVVEGARQAREAGGRVLTGGDASEGNGWFVGATVVDGISTDHSLAQEEVFGPICAILPVKDDSEAVQLSNSVRYGLVTAVFTSNLDRALAVVDGVDTGLVKVNSPTSGVDFYLPFGGEKESSYGPREQGKAARELYTSTRTVTIAPHGG
jgi:aldehyde dehydrogenase (NAD+)